VRGGVLVTRAVELMLGGVMSGVVLMSLHGGFESGMVDMTKQADGSQRPSNWDQESDQQQQDGAALDHVPRLSHGWVVAMKLRGARPDGPDARANGAIRR